MVTRRLLFVQDGWRGDANGGRTAEYAKGQEMLNQKDKKRKRNQGDKNKKI